MSQLRHDTSSFRILYSQIKGGWEIKTKILFVCSGNRDRSPTAETLYRGNPNLEVESAGISPYADTRLTEPLIRWADIVVVMENAHEVYIRDRYPEAAAKPLFCLNIQDRYRFMDSALANLIEQKMKPILERCLKTEYSSRTDK